MDPFFENIPVPRGSSFGFRLFRLKAFPFRWHVHPEVELTLIHSGFGRRLVGDDISSFGPGDLVLLGSDLPHTWASDPEASGRGKRCVSTVVQFLPDFLGRQMLAAPEFGGVARLLERARRGLVFTGRARAAVAERIGQMATASPAGRLMLLLDALLLLSGDRTAKPLCSAGFRPAPEAVHRTRIAEVCAFLNQEYERPIRLAEAAKVAHLSPHSFGRFFRNAMGKGFTDYLNELRVGRACDLLIRTDRPILSVATEAGFENLSNFNRRFLALKGMRPREFRQEHARLFSPSP